MQSNLRLLAVGVAIRMFGNALFFPFLALFLHGVLNVGYLELGVIIFGVGLAQLPFSILGGLATDRVGRRPLILIGLASEAVATLGLAYAFALHSLPGAIAAAIVGGGIATAAGPAFSAYIADFAHGPERTRGFTWYRIGFNAGYSAGVTAGGLLIPVLNFPLAVAVGAGVIGAGAFLLFLRLDPSPFDRALPARRSSSSQVEQPSPDGRSGGLAQSLRTLARDRVALLVALAFALVAFVVGQWAIIFPLFVRNVLGVPLNLLGVGLALNGLVVVFGQSFTTEHVLGRRHTTLGIVGTLLYVVSFLGLGVAGLFGFFPVVIFFLAVLVLTFGENLVTIPQTTLPSNLAPSGEVGSYNGAFQTIASAGFLIAVVVGGAVLAFTANPVLIWVILVAPALPAVLLLRLAARRMRPEVDRA
ncbi:MAG: MFS transporter [Thermoplasmata archaeon]|nr:MFS transporter [Thermoplasmata archaeon]